MTRSYTRKTVANSVKLEGLGLHSGSEVSVVVNPGKSGLRFWQDGKWELCHPSLVTDTSRCTRLGNISTVEHLLSALAGLEITDCDIEVNGGELPACDGCAMPYIEKIEQVGTVNFGELIIEGPFARIFTQQLPTKYAVGLGEGWWRANYVRENTFIGSQEFELEINQDSYKLQIARARTFVLSEELDLAQRAGLGRGLTKESCLIVGSDNYENVPRFNDEPARHKLLDMIGDLYLTGVPLKHLDVVAEYSGHKLNVEIAYKLAQAVTITRN